MCSLFTWKDKACSKHLSAHCCYWKPALPVNALAQLPGTSIKWANPLLRSLQECKLCKTTAVREAYVLPHCFCSNRHNTNPGSPKSHPFAPQKVLGFWGCFWLSVFGIKLPHMPLQKDSSFRSIYMYLKTPTNKFVLKPQVLGVHGSSFCLEMIAAHHSSFLQHCTESLMLFIAFTLEQLKCKKRKTFKTTRPFQEKCQPFPPYWITKVGRLVKQKPTVATESKEPSVRQDVAGTERKSHKNIFITAVTA